MKKKTKYHWQNKFLSLYKNTFHGAFMCNIQYISLNERFSAQSRGRPPPSQRVGGPEWTNSFKATSRHILTSRVTIRQVWSWNTRASRHSTRDVTEQHAEPKAPNCTRLPAGCFMGGLRKADAPGMLLSFSAARPDVLTRQEGIHQPLLIYVWTNAPKVPASFSLNIPCRRFISSGRGFLTDSTAGPDRAWRKTIKRTTKEMEPRWTASTAQNKFILHANCLSPAYWLSAFTGFQACQIWHRSPFW